MPLHQSESALQNTIILDGNEYQLLSGNIAEELEKRSSARRWRVTSRRLARQINPSRNVRPGEIDGEWLLVIEGDDWRRGQGGSRGAPGQHAFAFYANGVFGYVMQTQGPLSYSGVGNATGSTPATILLFNGLIFIIHGRYAFKSSTINTFVEDRDFGAGAIATDAIVHNGALYVGFGGSTNKIQSRNSAGTWSTATDNVYITHFTHVQDRLWVNQSNLSTTNQVSNIGPTDNPFTLSLYSSGITVGESTYGITDLNGYGERLAVSKPEGLYIGDAAAIFPNVLPQLLSSPDIDNGKSTIVRGADIFYPHTAGLIRYNPGRQPSVEEVGLSIPFGDHTDREAFVPASRVRSLAAQGPYIWAACEQSSAPWVTVSVKTTIDNGASYSDYSTLATDNDLSSQVSITAMDTVANGDWLLVGVASGSPNIHGFFFDGIFPNTATSAMTVAYWNGSGWTNYSIAGTGFWDGTSSGGFANPSSAPTITLSRSGLITFPNGTQPTLSTIDGLSRKWWRISVDAALSSGTAIGEIRAIAAPTGSGGFPYGMLYRLRAAEPFDLSPGSLVWEGYTPLYALAVPTAMLAYGPQFTPFSAGGNLLVASALYVNFIPLPIDGSRAYIDSGSAILSDNAYFTTVLMDGGAPNINKQWTRIRIRSAFSQNTTIKYAVRTDDTADWSADTTITSDDYSAALSGISGQRIAIRFNLGQAGTNNQPRILGVELVFRTLDTYAEEYEALLLVADGLTNDTGGSLDDAKTQITNLEALRGTAAKTLIDPLGQSKTVTVFEVNEVEAYKFGLDTPGMAVQIRMVEE